MLLAATTKAVASRRATYTKFLTDPVVFGDGSRIEVSMDSDIELHGLNPEPQRASVLVREIRNYATKY